MNDSARIPWQELCAQCGFQGGFIIVRRAVAPLRLEASVAGLADLADSRRAACHRSVNAPTESFFDRRKTERVHGTTYATRTDAQADLFAYIEVFHNRSRRHSTLGYSSPVRFLENWISQHVDQQPEAA